MRSWLIFLLSIFMTAMTSVKIARGKRSDRGRVDIYTCLHRVRHVQPKFFPISVCRMEWYFPLQRVSSRKMILFF